MAVTKMIQTQQIVIGIAIVVAIVMVGIVVLVATSRGKGLETGTVQVVIRNYSDQSLSVEQYFDGELKHTDVVQGNGEIGYTKTLVAGTHTILIIPSGKALANKLREKEIQKKIAELLIIIGAGVSLALLAMALSRR